ncbi:MAG: hypothetical protein OEW19_01310, partial [Acidobacteriota bacterium]|nr:hypothetical protein [Acidobacteriota bacterium]
VASGRVEVTYARAVTSVPGWVYVSTETGSSVYLSQDGGATWGLRSSPGHLGSQGWYDNVIWAGHPTNAALVIVGGIDLWRSTNSGTNFTKISQWQSAPTSAHADHHAIVAHPGFNGTTNNQVFFGNDGGIYRATDVLTVSLVSGWTELNNTLGITQFYGAGVNPSTGWIVGGTQDNGTLVYKGNSQAWTSPFGGDGGFSAYDPADSNYCYGEYVYLQIHRSTNGCVSSSYIFTGGQSGANFIAPFILDPNNVNTLLGGGGQLWRSTNVKAAVPTFASIKASIGSPISAIAVRPGNSNECLVGHNNGNLYKATDCTAATPTWTQIDGATLPNRYLTDLAISGTTYYATFGGFAGTSGNFTNGNVWKSTNSGSTWTNIHGTLPAAPMNAVAINPTNANWIYVGSDVGLFTSQDGGASWYASNDGPADVQVDELVWGTTSQLYAVTHGRGIWRATISSYGAPPVAATLLTPSGSGVTSGQQFRWNAVSNSTWYRLWVQTGSTVHYSSWLTAAQTNCPTGGGVCSFTPPITTPASLTYWWVQTWNPLGYGPWSLSKSYTPSLVSALITSTWPVANTPGGGQATLWGQVRNTGAVSFPAGTRVWFKVTGPGYNQWVGSALVQGQAVGTTAWYSFIWDVPIGRTAGAHTYSAQVWTAGPAAISTASARAFTVLATPAQASRIVSLWPVGQPLQGTSVDLWALAKNSGSGAWPAGTRVWYWVRGPGIDGYVGSVAAPSLASGVENWYKYTWPIPGTLLPGFYSYYAIVIGPNSDWSPPLGFEVVQRPPGTTLGQDDVTNTVPGPDVKSPGQ